MPPKPKRTKTSTRSRARSSVAASTDGAAEIKAKLVERVTSIFERMKPVLVTPTPPDSGTFVPPTSPDPHWSPFVNETKDVLVLYVVIGQCTTDCTNGRCSSWTPVAHHILTAGEEVCFASHDVASTDGTVIERKVIIKKPTGRARA